ncbi:SDR family NAD(P)-dependent oxidoreductase [Bradyrhizobium sp. 200]|uniref:SDR family NAD(P)-dependent oxidoreductase n=1 Tax=Bradyrhizobium sp. 200 TaxID=2782665 RepID=UPI001FFED3B5|nr:SDR family NAD(P)-dependent oxidoreductase [Bradyrhizobium sp. 200]UPJ47806.1 SDR family NAD(P)-dependent oxidoreductase [Bradyrhizobium sp. 200]
MQNVNIKPKHSMGLHGKVALVVGGHGAIGTTVSQTLVSAGATIVIAGRNGDQARALADQLSDKGYIAEGLELEASNGGAIREFSALLIQHYGSIDIVVKCVGINKEQSLLEVTEEAFDKVISKKLRSFIASGQQSILNLCGGAYCRPDSNEHLMRLSSCLIQRQRSAGAIAETRTELERSCSRSVRCQAFEVMDSVGRLQPMDSQSPRCSRSPSNLRTAMLQRHHGR